MRLCLRQFTSRVHHKKCSSNLSYFMDSLLEMAFSISHSGVELLLSGTVSDLKYKDDVLLSGDPGSLQDLLCSLFKSALMFGMHF